MQSLAVIPHYATESSRLRSQILFGLGSIFASRFRQGDLNGRHNTDHIPQPHRIRKPTHGLFCVSATFGITSLVLMGFRQESKPAETAGLNHRQVQIRGVGFRNPLTFLLHQQPQTEIVKLGQGAQTRLSQP